MNRSVSRHFKSNNVNKQGVDITFLNSEHYSCSRQMFLSSSSEYDIESLSV